MPSRSRLTLSPVTLPMLLFCLSCDSGGSGNGSHDLTGPSPTHPQSDGRGGRLYEGTLPAPQGFSNDFHIRGERGTGSTTDVEICVWDSGNLIDGDEIQMTIGGRQLLDAGSQRIRLTGTHRCVTWQFTTGYYYTVRVLALNEGTDPPNTGSVSFEADTFDDGTWVVHQGAYGESSLVLRL